MAEDKPKRGTKARAARAARKRRVVAPRKAPLKTARAKTVKKAVPKKTVAKKTSLKKSSLRKAALKKASVKSGPRKAAVRAPATKRAPAAKDIPARKTVPIKTARVRRRALLPPLPPPPALPLKVMRGQARLPARAKARGAVRAKSGKAILEIPPCTEALLRQKLRRAAPYLELWLAGGHESAEAGLPTPEAAFVRIWQWLTLESPLEDGQIAVTPDLIAKLYAEEVGRRPTGQEP